MSGEVQALKERLARLKADEEVLPTEIARAAANGNREAWLTLRMRQDALPALIERVEGEIKNAEERQRAEDDHYIGLQDDAQRAGMAVSSARAKVRATSPPRGGWASPELVGRYREALEELRVAEEIRERVEGDLHQYEQTTHDDGRVGA